MDPVPLLAAETIPIYIPGTASSFYKSIGVKKPDRDAVRLKLQAKKAKKRPKLKSFGLYDRAYKIRENP